MKTRSWLPSTAVLCVSLLIAGCHSPASEAPSASPAPAAETARASTDAIYSGGDILTMEGDTPAYVEALVVRDGRIAYAGDLAGAQALRLPSTRDVDLAGHTLVPGFIDAHGHAWMTGFQKLTANLLPPPDGEGQDVAAVVRLLSSWAKANPTGLEGNGWIIGFGYDDSQLAEKRHPTAADLDKVSTEQPVLIIHQSSHLGAMNHKAMALMGIGADRPDPEGGAIRREADGRTPNGVLEEMALFGPLFTVLGGLGDEANARIALAGADYYAQFGYTTAQEGRASKDIVETWQRLGRDGKLKIDIAAYPDLAAEEAFMRQTTPSREYVGNFRIAGVKLSLDGSPQGKTAWLGAPYLHPPAGQPDDYRGYPAFPDNARLRTLVALAFQNNWQILAHANGDAAGDALIDAVEAAAGTYGNDDRRTVMIHAQTVREDQLDRMQALGIVPSFFSMHTYYWGDWHRDETLGKARAYRISPTASALARGMWFTEHHDAPVALPSSLMVLHTTVNRTSRSGDIIGPDQRVSPYIAMKTLTDWAARQYFEEAQKGTLTVGKVADLTILDGNPLKVAPATLKDLRVLETIKAGRTVHAAE